MQAYVRFPQFKSKAVTLSYDDCVRQDKRLIAIMQKHGLKGTFNVNGGKFAESFDGVTTKGNMTVEEALELYNSSGMEVAVHGYKHLSLAEVDSAIALNDVIEDRKTLEKVFGRVVKGMAYANGSYDDDVVEMLKKCGISYARTTVATGKFDLPTDRLRLKPTCKHTDPRLMDLAKEFVEKSFPYPWYQPAQLFYLWGHSFEFDNDGNWNVIEEFAEYVGGRDDIWYATNGEIFEYLQAIERLNFSVDASFVNNPSAIDAYIYWYGKEVLIPAGKTVRL